MTTRNGLNAAYESPLTDSRDEQTATQSAADSNEVAEGTADAGNKIAEPGAPFELDLDTTQDALRTQLNELVRALSDKLETEPADERDDFQDDFDLPNVVNRSDEPVCEPEEWQTTFSPVSLEAMKNVLSKPLYGFVAGLMASAAVGGGVLLFTPLMSEPPALASNEAAPDQTPVFASVAFKAEQPAPKMQGRLPSAGEPQQSETVASDSSALVNAPTVEIAALAERVSNPAATSSEPLPAAEPAKSISGEPQEQVGEGNASASDQTASVETVVTFDTIVKPSGEKEEQEVAAVNSKFAAEEAENSTEPARIAQAVTHVNMRAGPNNAEPIVAVVSEGSPVKVVQCSHWCEVIFSGQRGWIYGDLISMRGASENNVRYN